MLRQALEQVLRHPVSLTCAGRTDAGVHGWGQVVSFDAEAAAFDAARLQASLNGLCGPAVVAREVAVADRADFDARFDATARRYRYTILNRPVPDPFLAATAWHVAQPLDLRAMQAACDPLIGEHDFTSFCRRPKDRPEASLVRRVLGRPGSATRRRGRESCGSASRPPPSATRWSARSPAPSSTSASASAPPPTSWPPSAPATRSTAGPVAAPHGLCLWEVLY